jgi:hypothetical protein
MTATGNRKISQEETRRNHQEVMNGDQVSMKKRTGGVANRRETSGTGGEGRTDSRTNVSRYRLYLGKPSPSSKKFS